MKAIALAVIVLLIAVPASAQSTRPVPAKNLHWIVSQSSIYRLRQGGLSESQLQALFDNPNTYVIVNARKRGDMLTHAKHVMFYRDETMMAADLAAGKLASYSGVLYDDEAYSEPGNTTPEAQKENPLPYVQNAAQVLHAAGKLFIYTIGPGVGPKGEFWTRTLPSVSRYPDVIDFQTQAAEGTPRFAKQVAHYSRVYRGNGGHLMLVGLAVSPKGRPRSAADIESAYDAALANHPPVDGFWLNIAVRSKSCTGCAQALDIAPGVEFLRAILP